MKLGIGIISVLLMSALCTEAAIFMEYDDIEGESTAEGHEGQIDILSFSWGVSHAAPAGGGGALVPQFNDLVITKRTDKSSPLLMLSTASGKQHPRVVLTLTREGEPKGGYYTITLEEVLVTSFQTSGNAGDDRPTESLSLNYTKIKFEYTPMKADGTPDRPVVFGWDVKANTAY